MRRWEAERLSMKTGPAFHLAGDAILGTENGIIFDPSPLSGGSRARWSSMTRDNFYYAATVTADCIPGGCPAVT